MNAFSSKLWKKLFIVEMVIFILMSIAHIWMGLENFLTYLCGCFIGGFVGMCGVGYAYTHYKETHGVCCEYRTGNKEETL